MGIKRLLIAFYALFSGEFSYHAGALTYAFIMVLGSVFSLVSLLAFYTPFLSYERLVSLIVQFVPQYAGEVIKRVAKIYESKATLSVLSIFLAYVFSVNFAKNLYRAFHYLSSYAKPRSEVFFWITVPIFVTLFSFLVPAIFFILTTIEFLPIKLPIGLLSSWLFFVTLVLLMYKAFLDITIKKILYASFIVSVILSFLNKILSLLLLKLVSLNPLYGVFGSLLIFLVWVYVSFQFILLGTKIINYEEGRAKT